MEENIPQTPEFSKSLSRELEEVISKQNLLTSRTRRRVSPLTIRTTALELSNTSTVCCSTIGWARMVSPKPCHQWASKVAVSASTITRRLQTATILFWCHLRPCNHLRTQLITSAGPNLTKIKVPKADTKMKELSDKPDHLKLIWPKEQHF